MRDKEYEQKRHDSWISFKTETMFKVDEDAFMAAFDRAYSLGKLQASCQQVKETDDSDVVIQGWVCRDKELDKVLFPTDLYLSMEYPTREEWAGTWRGMGAYIPLNTELFPDLSWDDEPQEVEITIKRKKNGNI